MGTEDKATEAAVKVEPNTEAEKVAIKVEELKSTKAATLRRFQEMELTMKVVKSKAEGNTGNSKYTDGFLSDVNKHLVKITKVIKILLRLCTEEATPSEMPALVTTLEEITQADTDLVAWATRFGYTTPDMKSKRRK